MSTFSQRIFITIACLACGTATYGWAINLDIGEVLNRIYFMSASLFVFWLINRKEFSDEARRMAVRSVVK